ncbi:MAG: division/cell wall cluster transcriptional repressor MraZ [Chlorobi bacterium]|nr:division/cell wall cluster transcriptional repressor MraZ [Chlorobiota bacterium]
MAAFIGDFTCKLDAKGRIVLPAPFKKTMVGNGSDRFVVRKNLYENCLVLTPFNQWEKELEKIRAKINPYNRDHNKFMRAFFRGLSEVSFDGNGRILIPRKLKDEIGAEQEVVLVGVDSNIEIWNSKAYHESEVDPDELGRLAEDILGKDDLKLTD